MSIWLIGGTRESVEIAQAIASLELPCLVTVTTEAARQLYWQLPGLKVRVGKIEPPELKNFLRTENIQLIVDASHPYATAISQAAISMASQEHLPYLRYERPSVKSSPNRHLVRELDSFATLIQGDYLAKERVLLTVGYKVLPQFQVWQDRATLFARILPATHSLEVALASGFGSQRLIAIRPPVSREVERALWQQWQISLVVSKASGHAAGEDIKRSLAQELGIPLIVITRPRINYPQQTGDTQTVLNFCQENLPKLIRGKAEEKIE